MVSMNFDSYFFQFESLFCLSCFLFRGVSFWKSTFHTEVGDILGFPSFTCFPIIVQRVLFDILAGYHVCAGSLPMCHTYDIHMCWPCMWCIVYVCRCWGPTLCWAILRTKVTSLSTSLIWTQLNFSAHLTASKLAQSSALLHIRPSSFFCSVQHLFFSGQHWELCTVHTEHCAALLLVGEVRGEISNPSDIELEGTEDTREIGHLQDYECCSMCHRGYLSFNDVNPM